VICWSCEREAGAGPLCAACRAPQPPNAAADHFSVLGLPFVYAVDMVPAEAAFKQLSRLVHPDRFATADPRARKASLGRTVQLNEAWRTLRDPVRRAEYMLSRAGVDVGSEEQESRKANGPAGEDRAARGTRKVAAPPAFLMEILELHDELGEARRSGDTVKVALMTEEMRARAAASMQTIATGLESGTPERLEVAAQSLIALRYYRRFLDEVERHQQMEQERSDHG
jgi:molecular chaperone HscB